MTEARTLTSALNGRWQARYGTAACPICQPEHRRDQNALTLAGHEIDFAQCLSQPDGAGQTDKHHQERPKRGAKNVPAD